MKKGPLATIYECEICKDIAISLKDEIEETPFVSCSRGHIFCPDHMNDISPEALQEIVEDGVRDQYISTQEAEEVISILHEENPISSLGRDVAERIFYPFWPSELHEEICPICTLLTIPDKVLIQKLLTNAGKTRAQVEEEIRNECETISDAVQKYFGEVDEFSSEE